MWSILFVGLGLVLTVNNGNKISLSQSNNVEVE